MPADLDQCSQHKALYSHVVSKGFYPITRRHDNLKFEENGRNLLKPVENTMEKGEISRYEQFLLFPQCFQKACFRGASKGVIVWEWVKLVVQVLLNCERVGFVLPSFLSWEYTNPLTSLVLPRS